MDFTISKNMKAFYNILAASAIAVFSLAACSDKEEYNPGEPELDGCYGVYFPSQEASGSHVYNPTADKTITIKVARTKSEGAITVPVDTISNVSGVFTFGDITFADGQSETTVDVAFDSIAVGKESALSFTISDPQYAYKYGTGATSLDFSILCVEYQYMLDPTTNEKAKVHWVQKYWGEECDSYLKYYEIDGVRYMQTETIPDSHVYNGENYTGYGFFGTAEKPEDAVEWSFVWYTEEENNVEGQFIVMPYQKTGWYHTTYQEDVLLMDNMTYTGAKDLASFLSKFGGNPDNDYPLSYYDGNGGFYIYVKYYYLPGAGGGFAADPWDVTGVVSGYVRTDYSISLATDLADDGVLPVYLELGADVDEVRYNVYDGELVEADAKSKAAEISKAEKGGYQSYTVDKNSAFGVTLDKSGVYTVVALAYAGGEYKGEYAAATFNYVTKDDAETYAPVVKIGTETVSDRYAAAGYTASNSFGFYIVGKDLTDVHVAFLETADYTGSEAKYNAQIKGNDKFALSADDLKAVNATGGYADIATDLKALTSYTVVVYASNGQQGAFQTATYTTSGLPNEVIIDGKGAYGYNGIAFTGYDEGLNLEYNPNTKQYEVPNWCNGVTLKFTVAEDGTVSVPIQSTGVNHSTYGTIAIMDVQLVDTFFGRAGIAEYLGWDTSVKGFVDEDGNYHFSVAYVGTNGYGINAGEQVFYINGKPADAPATESASVVAKSVPAYKCQLPVASEFVGSRAGVAYERQNYNAVDIKVSAVSGSHASRGNGRNADIVKIR